MLEQILYIDNCDTLGQKANNKDIHKVILWIISSSSNLLQALVSVYQKLVDFYIVALEILARKGTKLVMKMVLGKDRLPEIVQDFLKRAETLQKFVQKATWEIVADIKSMLYDRESKVLIVPNYSEHKLIRS